MMPISASWCSSPAPWFRRAVALAVAIPMGTVIAIYLSEFANGKVREVAKPILELLGGIPTIVFGYFRAARRHPYPADLFSLRCRASRCSLPAW
jgi:ABC-type phosphate transport system permease subunit